MIWFRRPSERNQSATRNVLREQHRASRNCVGEREEGGVYVDEDWPFALDRIALA